MGPLIMGHPVVFRTLIIPVIRRTGISEFYGEEFQYLTRYHWKKIDFYSLLDIVDMQDIFRIA